MKNICLMLVLSFILVGCSYNSHGIENVDKFDELVDNSTVRYDLRSYDECEAGHIPGFMCIDVSNSNPVEQAIYNITNEYSEYNKSDIIILIGFDTIDAKKAADMIASRGFKNVYYFVGGYQEYVEQKGDNFIPEIGCDC